MSAPTPATTPPAKLQRPGAPTPEQKKSKHYRKIRSAAFVAAFNAISIAACAMLSIQLALSMFSLVGLLIGAALGVFAYLEFRGRKRLLALDPNACSLLGWNQVAFMSLIVIYCAISLVFVYLHPEFTMEYPKEFEGRVKREEWDLIVEVIFVPYWGTIWKITYITVIVATVLAQGGNAIYYFTRRKHVLAHLAELESAKS